jgi:NADH:ubiquinone oxidoreductase subunit E
VLRFQYQNFNPSSYGRETIDRLFLEKYPPAHRESLIPILQEIQDMNGYISESLIVEVGRYLKMPTSKIFGLSTFFNQFRFEPPARFTIRICRGTSCHVNDSLAILAEFKKSIS